MAHLLNPLYQNLLYHYYMSQRPTGEKELLNDDKIHRFGTHPDIRKPNHFYADYGFVMTKDQIKAEQDAVDYPLVYTPVEDDDIKFSLDKTIRNVETYLVVPIVATTEMSSLKSFYHTRGADPTKFYLVPLFWDNAKMEAYKGSALENNDGEYFNFPLGSTKSNPGIVYIAFKYFGPMKGDPDFVDKWWESAEAEAPALWAQYDTGGRTPQPVAIGNSFIHASNDSLVPTSYMKMSLVEEVNGELEILCHKSCNLLVTSGQRDISLRITLTRPLPHPITMDLNFLSTMNLSSSITDTSTLERLEDVYGVEATGFFQYSIREAQRATLAGDTVVVSDSTATIPAGQTEVLIPIGLKAYNGRYFTEVSVENISDRTGLKLLNNGILLTVHDASIDESLVGQGLYYSIDVFENGRKIDSFNVGETHYMDVPDGRIYEAVVTVNCLDVESAKLKARYGQPISSAFEPSARHQFTGVTLENDQGIQLESDIVMLTPGKHNVMVKGNSEQQFKFPVNLSSSEQEITLSLANDVTTLFNGRTDVGKYSGFTFRKV